LNGSFWADEPRTSPKKDQQNLPSSELISLVAITLHCHNLLHACYQTHFS
jgi:hypothetical protein